MLAVKIDKGVAKVPDNARVKGADGRARHGDAAIAKALVLYAVNEMEGALIDFTPVPPKASRWDLDPEDDNDINYGGAGAW